MEIKARAEVRTSKGLIFYIAFIYKTRALKYGSYDTNKGLEMAQKIADYHGLELAILETRPLEYSPCFIPEIDLKKLVMKGKRAYSSLNGNYAILSSQLNLLAYHSIK